MKKPGIINLILKNISSRPYRYGILVICVAAVVGIQAVTELIEYSTKSGVQLGLSRMGADLVAVPRGLSRDTMKSYKKGQIELFYIDKKYEQELKKFDFIKMTSPQLYIKSLQGATCCTIWSIYLIGYDPDTDFVIKPWLDRNRDVKLGPYDILLGPFVKTPPGKEYRFFGQDFEVAGVLDKTGTAIDNAIFVPIKTVYKIIEESPKKAKKKITQYKNKISSILIKLKKEEEGGVPEWKAVLELERSFKDITIIQPIKMVRKMRENLKTALTSLQSASYAIWPVTALLIGLVFAMSSNERRREIGLFRAMGATRIFIFKIIMFEALVIAFIGTILGIAVSLTLSLGFSNYIIPDFIFPGVLQVSQIFLIAVLIALTISVISAFFPALKSSTEEPYEAIRKGE